MASIAFVNKEEHRIPAEKRLSQPWVRSLFQRGRPRVYRDPHELQHIGMPVGGICTGQVYLGGDGRLWHWDIFAPQMSSDYPNMARGIHYANPQEPKSPLRQGFALAIREPGQEETVRELSQKGFADIAFEGRYPLGRVTYRDPDCPVEARLEAFSPFIPLNSEDSGLPLTVLEFRLRNNSNQPLACRLFGWLENAVAKFTGHADKFTPHNQPVSGRGWTALECSAQPRASSLESGVELERLSDFGTMALAVLRGGKTATITPVWEDAIADADTRPVGQVSAEILLEAGKSATVTFALAWYFPNYGPPEGEFGKIEDIGKLKRYYARRFQSAQDVLRYFVEHRDRLTRETRLWVQTWYDSTLPYWFLDRSFLTIDCLATATCHRFDNGRFYGWEGVYCCPGTCQHVWNYAQGLARIFPDLERDVRERVDYGIGWHDSGELGYRAEEAQFIAHDGQAGTILRVYREHTMSRDDAFLRRLWPRVKKSLEYLLQEDADNDGVLKGKQFNTLDAAWYGPISWISSLYLAALRCGAEMAQEMGDPSFADELRARVEQGSGNLVEQLFNGEFFIQKRDPNHPEAIGYGGGCHIDQVLGDSLLHAVGLEPILPRDKVRSALRALWKYNYKPDVGPYRQEIEKTIPGGRWYAMPGEAGLVMTTWPRGGAEEAPGKGDATFIGYFNECMTGFEYQAAAHLIAEGMLEEGLSVCRTIDERYHPSRRNPYNEIECSDHYARAMASYGAFLTLCGFAYHGPSQSLRFAPKLRPHRFQAAFTVAEGWGTFTQAQSPSQQTEKLTVAWGQVALRQLEFAIPPGKQVSGLRVAHGADTLSARHQQTDTQVTIQLDNPVVLTQGESLILEMLFTE